MAQLIRVEDTETGKKEVHYSADIREMLDKEKGRWKILGKLDRKARKNEVVNEKTGARPSKDSATAVKRAVFERPEVPDLGQEKEDALDLRQAAEKVSFEVDETDARGGGPREAPDAKE